MSLQRRAQTSELMDEPTLSTDEMGSTLKEVDAINRYLGGWATSEWLLRPFLRTTKLPSILDVGAGSGATARALQSHWGRRGWTTRWTLVDLHPSVCRVAGKEPRGFVSGVVRADARHLPFPDRTFDVAHASLFLHHLGDQEISQVIREMTRVSRHGLVINDLERHGVALAAIRLITGMFSRNRCVRHDAPVSVRRGFRKGEILQWGAGLESASFEIQRRFPFRWAVRVHLPATTR